MSEDEPHMIQVSHLVVARQAYFDSHDLLTSAEVAALGGSSARNTSALASRWKAERNIFALTLGRIGYFPAIQFGNDGRPWPAVEEVSRLFEGEEPSALTLWSEVGSGWLGGRAPDELLATEPDAVMEAARRS